MTREKPHKPAISTFRSVPPSTSSRFSEEYSSSRDEDTVWADQYESMRSLRDVGPSFQPMESSFRPSQSLYRDASGVSLSSLTIDRNGQSGRSGGNQHHFKTRSLQQSRSKDGPRRFSSDITVTEGLISSDASTSFLDKLPPGFPIPEGDLSKPAKRKLQSVRTRSKQIVRPVVSQNSLRTRGTGPSRNDSTPGVFSSMSLQHFASREANPQDQSFQIRDSDKVVAYLKEKLILLQQQSLKVIAKEWVKAICPKKQSRFPYSTKKKRDGKAVPVIPPWWPSSDICPYVEPDHIAAEYRVNLLIHLLRLRPSHEAIRNWAWFPNESNYSSKLHPCGQWTASLRDLTPVSLLDVVGREPKDKVDRRPELLQDLFRVAELEEDMYMDGNDGTDMIAWIPDPEVKHPSKKRSRGHAVVATQSETASVDGVDLESSRDDSSEEQQRGVKRAKRDARENKSVRTKISKAPKLKKRAHVIRTPSSPTTEELSERHPGTPDPIMHDVSTMGIADEPMVSSTNASLTTSFGSNSSADTGWSNTWHNTRTEIPMEHFACNSFRQHRNPQVNSVYDISQPQFSATPGLQQCSGDMFTVNPHALSITQPQTHHPEAKPEYDMFSNGSLSSYNMLTPQTVPGRRQHQSLMPHNEAQRNPHMAESNQWQPLTLFPGGQMQAQPSDPCLSVANTRVPSSVPIQPGWHSGWSEELQRPHGLPVHYDDGVIYNFDPAGSTTHGHGGSFPG